MDHESAGEARPPKRGRSRRADRGGVEAADESDESDACESPRSSKSSTAQTSTGDSRGGVGWMALRGVPSSDDDSSESDVSLGTCLASLRPRAPLELDGYFGRPPLNGDAFLTLRRGGSD